MIKNKLLFSSVCKPIGPSVGDGESVGYELLHGQVTRSQHIYSPRVVHKQFSLDYIAENLDCPSTVLHYPSKRTFISELKKGYEVLGISFVLSTFHHAKIMCELARKYSPQTKIILGGYGTVVSDEELTPICDAICKEEGVGFMRRYLGQPTLAVEDYIHPTIRSRLRIFGIPVSHTAMIFAGLGCPNGCDFCSTSHFFKREHIKLLPTGDNIFEVMKKHREIDPNMDHTILDEDFLLNKKRGLSFLHRCRKEKMNFSTFAFASVKALSQYTMDELTEMGIDGVWVGYEGKKSGYEKHDGVDIDKLIAKLQDHGITVLSSMILGIPYQSEDIARKEFKGLLQNSPCLTQYLIYGPTPGTPFYENVMKDQLLDPELVSDRIKYYKKCTGFYAMVKHPSMEKEKIEKLQREFYQKDFETLGPSIFRIAEVKLSGYHKYHNHVNPLLRSKALVFRQKLITFLAILPIGIFGPKISMYNRRKYLKLFFHIFKMANWKERAFLFALPIMATGAIVSWINRIMGQMEHPITRVHKHFGRKKSKRSFKKYRGFLRPLPARSL
ncbi:MAG: hypothetical protein HOE90_22000 [Bacteriovoracaceae bacterium]|nr:hypothetical protein [Bacteriovoracaceae bacterium]